MPGVKLTGGDTMNYWIKDFRPQLLETLKQWDFLLINDSEARLLSGEYNLRRAAAKIMELGPHTLVVKRGRIRRDSVPARAATSWCRATCWKMSSTRPARAIVSPADSSGTWRGEG